MRVAVGGGKAYLILPQVRAFARAMQQHWDLADTYPTGAELANALRLDFEGTEEGRARTADAPTIEYVLRLVAAEMSRQAGDAGADGPQVAATVVSRRAPPAALAGSD